MDPRDLVDDALELLVAPSFSRIGYDLRRRMYGWDEDGHRSLAGRTVLVTGPTSGLGRAAVSAFAAMGARLLLVGRDDGRLERVRTELVAWTGHQAIATYRADMSSLASVREAADAILADEPRIDVIVDNAGAMFPTRTLTDEGFELSLATMVLGPFVLTSRLLPLLTARPGGRLVAVTSGGLYAAQLHLDDLSFAEGVYSGTIAYARAKRSQVTLMREWARRLRPYGVVANAAHPGWADTPGLVESLPGFARLVGRYLRTPTEGADTIVWLASAEEAGRVTGKLFLDRRVRPFDRVPMTRLSSETRRALWDRVEAMTGERPFAGGDARLEIAGDQRARTSSTTA